MNTYTNTHRPHVIEQPSWQTMPTMRERQGQDRLPQHRSEPPCTRRRARVISGAPKGIRNRRWGCRAVSARTARCRIVAGQRLSPVPDPLAESWRLSGRFIAFHRYVARVWHASASQQRHPPKVLRVRVIEPAFGCLESLYSSLAMRSPSSQTDLIVGISSVATKRVFDLAPGRVSVAFKYLLLSSTPAL